MKRLIISIIILLSGFVVQGQQSYTFSGTLDGVHNYHYTANSHIILSPGFKSEPAPGRRVILDIDSYGVFPPKNGITGGSANNNEDGVVGSLGGIIDVGLLGGATYTIPIDLPEGLGGMSPQLSISYNSQSHNGLLGWAWSLNGISSITRTGRTRYHDGYSGAINYSQDRFSLDGQRLLKDSSSNYGGNGTTYRTEQDQLNKIVSYQESGISGPSYFKVWTADGKILYYGSSSDSKALKNSQNYVGVWLLKRIEDRDGNYIEYHYYNGSDTYYLSQITYSGNTHDNIQPTISVVFQYDNRDDIETSFTGNSIFKQKKLLTGITIKNANVATYAYQFRYHAPDGQNGYPYHLLTDIQLSGGDEHLNPTKIRWGNSNYNINSTADVKLNVTTLGISNAFYNAVKFSGDFNGDGYTDVIVSRQNSDGKYTSADVFINKGVNGNAIFEHKSTMMLNTNISWIHVADFNGDGLDDILLSNRTRYFFPFPDYITTFINISHISPSGTLSFHTYPCPTCQIPHNMVDTHLVGDFFGDGKNSILIQTITNDKTNNSKLLSYNADVDQFLLTEIPESLSANRFYTADYNGDGITEILYKNESGATSIVQVRPTNNNLFHYIELYNGSPYQWDDCFPGDYNGDGLVDCLFYKPNTNVPWTIRLSNHLGISVTTYTLPTTFPYNSPGNYLYSLDQPNHTYQYIKVADFDGNGCSDLGLFANNYFYVFYGPLRNNSDNAPFASSQLISTQLFGLYDNMTVCLGNFLGQDGLAYLGNSTISHLPSLTKRHEVKEVINGFGRITEFNYDYLMPNPNNPSENDFYRLVSLPTNYPPNTRCVGVPLRALRKVTTYNINEKPLETWCYYENALLNTNGKGFLGFRKTRQSDYCNYQLQQKTVRQYDLVNENGTFCMMPTEEYVYDYNSQLMAKSTYQNALYTNNRNSKIFIPLSNVIKDEYQTDNPGILAKREIQETTVATYCSQTHMYDNVISITSQVNGITASPNILSANLCEHRQIANTTYLNNNLDLWLINKPATTTKAIHRDGNYNDICQHKVFTYYNDDARHLKTILDLPNNGSHPEDRLALLTTYQYDPVGNITSKTLSTPNDSQSPRRELYEYSPSFGRRLLTKFTDALGQSVQYHYDPHYNYCNSTIDCNGLETQYEQDPFGINQKTIHPDGTVTCKAIRWSNDSYYHWEKKTGKATESTYYGMTGDMILRKYYDLDGETILQKYDYDDFGRITSKALPRRVGESLKKIRFQYDGHNRTNRINHPDGTYETIQYDGNNRSTTFVAQDGTSHSETKTYNTVGWLTKSTDANGSSVIYDYYADGKPKWFQIEGHNETRITTTYDALGNRISLSDPDYGMSTYEYNAFNELTKSKSAKMDETDYYYDALGRVIQRDEIDNVNHTTEVTEWHYGQSQGQYGLLMAITSPNQTTTYEYDEFQRLSGTTDDILGSVYQTRYAYDSASRVKSVMHPSNYLVNYCYTSEGYVRSVMDSHSKELWRAAESNPQMQPTRCVTGNGFVSHYSYNDDNGRLMSIQTLHNGHVIQDYTYQYDDFSNMTRRNDQANTIAENFSYDALNRLTGVTDQQGTSLFHYDELGRMTAKTGPNGALFTNACYTGERPHAIKSVQTSPGLFPQERMDLVFTSFDKVSHIAEGNNNVSFQYGHSHQRIKVSENIDGVLRNKTYVGACEFIDTRGGQPMARTLLTSPTGVFAVAETVGGKTTLHYVHKDHLGSWTTISDSHGNIEQESHFDAWGNCQNADNLMFDRGFTGHEHIRGMKLINMNGRLYDPVTSSMLSPDNNIQKSDYTQNLNRYSYCFNNPLTYSDPDGNTIVGNAMLFYFLFCTDYGYEIQKYASPVAFHMDLHLSSQQLGLGADCSIGIPKSFPVSTRLHGGATYYRLYYDHSYQGMEYRAGMEWCFLGILGISGTSFYQGDRKQTTNAIILGAPSWSVTYENDYMFHLGDRLLGSFAADGGDRYRSAAARIRIGLFQVGVNLFTGDPGHTWNDRRTFYDPNTVSTYYDEDMGGRETYTTGAHGENPNEFRAGVFYVGFGPIKVGANNEQIRNTFQNRFAHDFLCKGDSPYFQVLNRPRQSYFHFGTCTGNTLW